MSSIMSGNQTTLNITHITHITTSSNEGVRKRPLHEGPSQDEPRLEPDIQTKVETEGTQKRLKESGNGPMPELLARPTKNSLSSRFQQTFTITLGDMAENHVGMQKIGILADHGFSLENLMRSKAWFESRGIACELVALHDLLPQEYQNATSLQAFILIARGGLNCLLDASNDVTGADCFYREQGALKKDKKALMYKKVVNKHARHNLCFGHIAQEPDYEAGKGRVVPFDQVPLLNAVRHKLPQLLGDVGADLQAEGNYYYNPQQCGIGFHGDSERKKVVGIRVGASLPLHFIWFKGSKPISGRAKFQLNHGDVYFFSEKATGCDWKRKVVPTLRHAAGAAKYLAVK